MFSTPLPKSSDIPQVDPQSPQDYIFHTPGDYPGYQNPANSSHPPFISRSIQLDAYVPSANPATKNSIFVFASCEFSVAGKEGIREILQKLSED